MLEKKRKTTVLFANLGRLEKLLFFHLLKNVADFEVIGIASSHKPAEVAYFLQYDSNHGPGPSGRIDPEETQKHKKLIFGQNKKFNISLFSRDAVTVLSNLKKIKVDVIIDLSSDIKLSDLTRYTKVAKYILALYHSDLKMNKKMQKIVFGFNHARFDSKKNICLIPSIEASNIAILLRSLKDKLAITNCSFDLIRGPTSDLPVLDNLIFHKQHLLGRSVFNNFIARPDFIISKTVVKMLDAEKITLPFEGQVIYAPATTGCLLSLRLGTQKMFKVSEINDTLKKEADAQMCFTSDPLVSQDVVASNHYGIIDKVLTRILTDKNYQVINLGVWFDSESSMAISCFRTLQYLVGVKKGG